MKQIQKLIEAKGLTARQIEELLKMKAPSIKVIKPRKTARYKFAVIADTHLVDKVCAISELYDFYARCAKMGITEIVHAGDLMHGINVYRGQINDLLCFGFQDHLDFAIRHYPQLGGITTYFIGGNHCESYVTHCGADILSFISKARPDMVYLGMYDATVILNGVSIGLHHGAHGVPYSISYHLQKYVEKIGAGQKPQIYVLGHYHSSLYMFYRNIHCFLPGCWQRPNNYSVRRGLPNLLGGWVIELEVANDRQHSITEISQRFIPYY